MHHGPWTLLGKGLGWQHWGGKCVTPSVSSSGQQHGPKAAAQGVMSVSQPTHLAVRECDVTGASQCRKGTLCSWMCMSYRPCNKTSSQEEPGEMPRGTARQQLTSAREYMLVLAP